MSLVPDLAGRVALVTGASRGIGRSIALALAQAGADVSSAEAVARLVVATEEALGPIDVLVNNAGMEGLTRGYAARLAKDGVTVNAVAPSQIETEMTASHRAETAARIPLGRLGTGEEVAQAVLMVIGNAYMTGTTVQVNGGLHFN